MTQKQNKQATCPAGHSEASQALPPKTQEEIPEMIQQILAIHQKEITRISLLECPTAQDINTSIKLMQSLTTAYMQYRVLKLEIRNEVQSSPEQMKARINQLLDRSSSVVQHGTSLAQLQA